MIPPANYTVEQPELLTLEFVREALSRAEEETLEMLAWEERQAAEALRS